MFSERFIRLRIILVIIQYKIMKTFLFELSKRLKTSVSINSQKIVNILAESQDLINYLQNFQYRIFIYAN